MSAIEDWKKQVYAEGYAERYAKAYAEARAKVQKEIATNFILLYGHKLTLEEIAKNCELTLQQVKDLASTITH